MEAIDSDTYSILVNYTLDSSQFVDIHAPDQTILRITASRPVQAIQLYTSNSSLLNPLSTLLVPTTLYGGNTSFTTVQSSITQSTNVVSSFIAIITKSAFVRDLLLDGRSLANDDFVSNWHSINGTDYMASTVFIPTLGRHTLSSPHLDYVASSFIFGQDLNGFVAGLNLTSTFQGVSENLLSTTISTFKTLYNAISTATYKTSPISTLSSKSTVVFHPTNANLINNTLVTFFINTSMPVNDIVSTAALLTSIPSTNSFTAAGLPSHSSFINNRQNSTPSNCNTTNCFSSGILRITQPVTSTMNPTYTTKSTYRYFISSAFPNVTNISENYSQFVVTSANNKGVSAFITTLITAAHKINFSSPYVQNMTTIRTTVNFNTSDKLVNNFSTSPNFIETSKIANFSTSITNINSFNITNKPNQNGTNAYVSASMSNTRSTSFSNSPQLLTTRNVFLSTSTPSQLVISSSAAMTQSSKASLAVTQKITSQSLNMVQTTNSSLSSRVYTSTQLYHQNTTLPSLMLNVTSNYYNSSNKTNTISSHPTLSNNFNTTTTSPYGKYMNSTNSSQTLLISHEDVINTTISSVIHASYSTNTLTPQSTLFNDTTYNVPPITVLIASEETPSNGTSNVTALTTISTRLTSTTSQLLLLNSSFMLTFLVSIVTASTNSTLNLGSSSPLFNNDYNVSSTLYPDNYFQTSLHDLNNLPNNISSQMTICLFIDCSSLSNMTPALSSATKLTSVSSYVTNGMSIYSNSSANQSQNPDVTKYTTAISNNDNTEIVSDTKYFTTTNVPLYVLLPCIVLLSVPVLWIIYLIVQALINKRKLASVGVINGIFDVRFKATHPYTDIGYDSPADIAMLEAAKTSMPDSYNVQDEDNEYHMFDVNGHVVKSIDIQHAALSDEV